MPAPKTAVAAQRGLPAGVIAGEDAGPLLDVDAAVGFLRLDDLRVFLVLVEESHFTNAATRLHVSSAALSRRIASLEQQVGVTLVDRSVRPIELTAGGLRMAAVARTVIAEIDGFRTGGQFVS